MGKQSIGWIDGCSRGHKIYQNMGLAIVCGQIPKGFFVCLLLFGKGIVQHRMEFSNANGRKNENHNKGRSDGWLENK